MELKFGQVVVQMGAKKFCRQNFDFSLFSKMAVIFAKKAPKINDFSTKMAAILEKSEKVILAPDPLKYKVEQEE